MKRSTELKRKTELKSHTELKRTPMNRRRKSKAAKSLKFWIVPTPKKPDGYTKELRDYIKERDGWCRVCGKPGHEVHHVIPRGRFRVHPEWYTFDNVHDERNLMYICLSCHDRATYHVEDLETIIRIQEKRFGPLRYEAALHQR